MAMERRAAKSAGHSAPFVVLSFLPAKDDVALPKTLRKARKTATRKKTLAPAWDPPEKFVFDDVRKPLPTLRVEVFDAGAGLLASKVTSLGHADLELGILAKEQGKTSNKREPQWLALEGSPQASGEVEVLVSLTAGTGDAREDALLEAAATRWFAADDEDDFYSKRRPNVLWFALIQARALKAVNRGFLGRGTGTSDPYVVVTVGAGTYNSPVIPKTVEPVWLDCGSLPLVEGRSFASLAVYDKDALTSTFLGGAHVDLATMVPDVDARDGAAPATWFTLVNEADYNGVVNEDTADCGEIQVALKLSYDPAADPTENRPFFEEAMEAECYDRPPNEVRVAVCRAKDLLAMDAASNVPFMRSVASSDPYAVVRVGRRSQRTRHRKKTLAPVWNAALALELHGGETEADVEVWDADLIGADDLIGTTSIDLTVLLARQGEAIRAWHLLRPAEASPDPAGSLLLVAQCRFNRAYAYAPFQDDGSGAPPNELRVALFRVRGLLKEGPSSSSSKGTTTTSIMGALLGDHKHAADSLRVGFKLRGQKRPRPFFSSLRDRADEAVWKEVFARPLELVSPGDTERHTLEVTVREVSSLTSKDNKVLGSASIEIHPSELAHGWYPIDDDGGYVNVVTQWWYNPALLSYEPLEVETDEGTLAKWPNQLVVALSQGRDLVPCDGRSVKGGREEDAAPPRGGASEDTSDTPCFFCTFELNGSERFRSAACAGTVDPVWCEAFRTECQSEPEFLVGHQAATTEGADEAGWRVTYGQLRVTVWDRDERTNKADDFTMRGQFDVDLEPLLDRRVHRRWFEVGGAEEEVGNDADRGDVELVVQWRYTEECDPASVAERVRREREAAASAEREHEAAEADRNAAWAAAEAARVFLEAAEARRFEEEEAAAAAAAAARRLLEALEAERRQWMGVVSIRAFDDDLFEAAATDDVETVEAYLAARASKGEVRTALRERHSRRGRALLHEAAQGGADAVVRLLVEKYGAALDVRTLFGGDTPLHLAAQNSHRTTVFFLVTHGADPDARNKINANPLHYATKLSVVRLLARAGADAHAVDHLGRAPVDCADANEAADGVVRELAEMRFGHERAAVNAALRTEKAMLEAEEAAIRVRVLEKRDQDLATFGDNVRRDYATWRRGEVNGADMLKRRTESARHDRRFEDRIRKFAFPEPDEATQRKLDTKTRKDGLHLVDTFPQTMRIKMNTFNKTMLTPAPDLAARRSMRRKMISGGLPLSFAATKTNATSSSSPIRKPTRNTLLQKLAKPATPIGHRPSLEKRSTSARY